MNLENSKTSDLDLHRLILNPSVKTNLNRNDKYITFIKSQYLH